MSASEFKLTSVPAFEITRVFDAPRSRVWAAWSEADQFSRWWGPKGCSIEVGRFEFQLGGFLHYAMKFAGAPTMWGRFNFREITVGERLVWLNSFSNESCGMARAPFSDVCPLEIENRVTFTEGAGSTTVALQARPFGATEAECRFFDELRSSMDQGYGGTFDQLSEHLARG